MRIFKYILKGLILLIGVFGFLWIIVMSFQFIHDFRENVLNIPTSNRMDYYMQSVVTPTDLIDMALLSIILVLIFYYKFNFQK